MGQPLLKVNGFDFGPYLNLQHEDGFDPVGADRIVPDFSGSPAFREGKGGVGRAVDNRAWNVPLVLEAPTRPELHALIRQVNAVLVTGASVEFATDITVDPSSFFTLEDGRLDCKYEYYLGVHGMTRATLNLWTTPHATTGTTRLIASIPQGSSAVVEFAATGLLGDMNPLANLEVRVGSAIASAGRLVAWGMHPHPSYRAYRQAKQISGQASTQITPSPTAIGSFYARIPISPSGASGLSYREYLTPPDAHVGRHRVFAIGRSGLTAPVTMYARDRFGAVLGPTAQASQIDVNKWQVVDLGEINVPGRATGQEAVPTQYVDIYAGGASGAGMNASPGFHLNGLMFLPLDYSAGIMRTGGAGAAGAAFGDSFTRYITHRGMLETFPISDGGESWAKISGGLAGGRQFAESAEIFAGTYHTGIEGSIPLNGVAGFYALGSGAMRADVKVAVTGGIGNINNLFGDSPSYNCASARIVVYPKMQASAAYAKVVWSLGPSPYMAIISGASPGNENLRASAGMPSIGASGFLLGQPHVLTVQALGGRMDAWLATGPLSPSPIVSASHAELGIPGHLGLQMFNGTVGQSFSFPANFLQVTRIVGNTLGGSAPDAGAREWFRFESHPEPRSYQGNASVFSADRTADYRGHLPELLPVPSSAASARPARMVVLQGEVDNIVGTDGPDIALTALERWEYLR